MDGRYVVLEVPAGAVAWREALPDVEVVGCAGTDEAVLRLTSSRPWSAVIGPAPVAPAVLAAAQQAGVPVVPIARPGAPSASVHARLVSCARPIPRADSFGGPPRRGGGRLVAVCGPGGTGASTVAMAMARAMGLSGAAGSVLLADMALRSGQAALHGLDGSSWSIDDLVHAYRGGRLARPQVRSLAVRVPGRPYYLLPGLRRPQHWTAIRPLSFDAALAGLQSAFSLLVADVAADVEGEAECGSLDIEERNHMARRVTATADIVVVVGLDGPTGRGALQGCVEALGQHGVSPERLVTVLNRVDHPLALPSFGPDVDLVAWSAPLVDRVAQLLDELPPHDGPASLVAIAPGSIGHWDTP